MEKIETKFKNLFILKSKKFFDNRGYLREIFKKKILNKKFIFDYYSLSKKNTLRGLHFQKNNQQDKLIIVLKGEIIDYCLDLRNNSKTFLKIYKKTLSSKNGMSLYVPAGFAHGFIAKGKENIVLYKNTSMRSKKDEMGIDFFDNKLNLKLNKKKYIISSKDKKNLSLNSFLKKYKHL